MSLTCAVIGIGARADIALHARAEGAHLVAAVDPDPRAQERARATFGDIARYCSVTELLREHPDLDAAIITSPDHTHAEIAVQLLAAGVACYLEKPLAITTADADRVLAEAKKSGAKLYVGHNMRHMHVVRLMRKLIDDGAIGSVQAIWCRHFVGNGGDYYFKDWHAERAKTTSLLLQKGAHDIDVIHLLAGGYSQQVVAMGENMLYHKVSSRRDNADRTMREWFDYTNWPPLAQTDLNPVIDVEDISMMTMRLDNGVLASYQQCHFTPDYWRNYTVIGDAGRLENFGDATGGCVKVWNRRSAYRAEADASYPITGDAGHGDADALTMGEFLRFVASGGPTETSPVSARQAIAAGCAATESLRGGAQPVTIRPLAAELVDYYDRHQAQ